MIGILPFATPIPAELVNPGASQPIRLRRMKGQWVGNGIWQEDDGAPVTITGRGIVYPSSPDDLLALPEGERINKSLTLYWPQKFQMNDRIDYDGEEYRVVRVDPWSPYGYHRAIAQVKQLG